MNPATYVIFKNAQKVVFLAAANTIPQKYPNDYIYRYISHAPNTAVYELVQGNTPYRIAHKIKNDWFFTTHL